MDVNASAAVVKRQARVRFGIGKAVIPYTLAFLCFFIPADYAVSGMLSDVWKVASLVAGAFCTLLLLCRKGIDAKFSFFFLFSFSFYVLSSAVAGSDAGIAAIIHYSVKLTGFFGLCAYGLQRNGRNCLAGFIAAGIIMCTANYVTYLQYGDIVGGMQYGTISFLGTLTTQHWFLLSSDNGTLFYYLPVAAAMGFYSLRFSRRFVVPTLVFCGATLYMYVELESVTALSVFGIFTILMVVLFIRSFCCSWQKSYSLSLLPIGAALLFCAAIISFLGNDFLLNLFYDIFGKSSSLQSRITIWERAIDYFFKSPLWGMGLSSSTTDIWRLTYNHTHNIILQVLYQGGIISFIFLVAACVQCIKIGRRDCTPEAFLLACAISLTIIGGTFDFYYHYIPQFFPLVMYGYLSSASLQAKSEASDIRATKNVTSITANGRRL